MRFWFLSICKGPSNDPRGCIEKRHMFPHACQALHSNNAAYRSPALLTSPPHDICRQIFFHFYPTHMGWKGKAHFTDMWGGMQRSENSRSKLLNTWWNHFQMIKNFPYILNEILFSLKCSSFTVSKWQKRKKGWQQSEYPAGCEGFL